MAKNDRRLKGSFRTSSTLCVICKQIDGWFNFFSSSSSDISSEEIIEFGINWIKETTSAVYDDEEQEKDLMSPDLTTSPDLPQFFSQIYTFLNGDIWGFTFSQYINNTLTRLNIPLQRERKKVREEKLNTKHIRNPCYDKFMLLALTKLILNYIW